MTPPTPLSRLRAGLAVALLGALPFAAHACDTQPFVGSICAYASTTCPTGYVPADGRIMRIDNASIALFSLISTQFGGDGRSNFALPDLRGRAPVGAGQGAGLQPVALAQQVGQQEVTLTPMQVQAAPHIHPAAFAPVTGPLVIPATASQLQVSIKLPVGTSSTGASSSPPPAPASGSPAVNAYLTAISARVGLTPVALSGPYYGAAPAAVTSQLPLTVSVGGSAPTAAVTANASVMNGGFVTIAAASAPAAQPMPTQAPGLGLTMCIAVQGSYPPRPN